MGRMNKQIAEKFIISLKEGELAELLHELKQDDTLSLEFRGDYISIYYRGGCISKLLYNEINNTYIDCFDSNYDDEDEIKEEPIIIKTSEDCSNLVIKLAERKRIMNKFFSKSLMREREYQQIVELENNKDIHSNYTITDIEYQKSNDCRFDMIAVQRRRQTDYKKLQLAIIELKYGIQSLSGASGIYKHYKDVITLPTGAIQDLIDETKFIMQRKAQLGLIQLLDSSKNGIEINNDSIDLIYAIVDVPVENSNIVMSELNQIQEDLKVNNVNINVKIFCPYLAGNVMFDNDMLSIEDFIKLNNARNEIIKVSEN